MNIFKIAVVSVSLILYCVTAQAGIEGEYWVVKRGDTLYGISRAVYPKSPRDQARFRKQLIELNQNIFAKGGGNLYLGAKLKLPEAVSSGSKTVIKKPVKASAQKKSVASLFTKDHKWRVKAGDSLYKISSKIYPKSNQKREQLRQDIVKLNPKVFHSGKSYMRIGMHLVMPDYLFDKKDSAKMAVVMPPTKSAAVLPETSKLSVSQSKTSSVKSKAATSPATDENRTERFASSSYSSYTSNISLSFGYSVGGDVAQPTQGGHDITFGSGAQLRLNYDGLWEKKQGYRLALGYQYDKVTASSDSAQLEQAYLQAMYLYNLGDSLLGAGLSYHDRIFLKTDLSNSIAYNYYEPAAGLVLMYEYKKLFGGHILGISYSSLESEDTVSLVKKDLSRAEIYYRLSF